MGITPFLPATGKPWERSHSKIKHAPIINCRAAQCPHDILANVGAHLLAGCEEAKANEAADAEGSCRQYKLLSEHCGDMAGIGHARMARSHQCHARQVAK